MRLLISILLLIPCFASAQMFVEIGYRFVPASGGGSSSNEWNVEIQYSQCGTANSDTFTVLVKIQSDSMKPTYKGGLTACLSGNDIRFYVTDTNTLLKWAVERYDPDSGILIAWVKIYSVSYTAATTFKMDCGRTTDTSTFKGGATGTAWKSTVIGAYFMNDATAANLTDNSAYGNTGTQTNSPVRSTGQVGYAEGFTAASTQYYTTTTSQLDGISAASFLYWGKRTSSGSNIVHGKATGGSVIACYNFLDGVAYFQINGTYGYCANTGTAWHGYGMVFDGGGSGNSGRCKIYIDGSNQSLSFLGTIPSALPSTAGAFRVGRDGTFTNYQSGLTDNLIIYKEAVSSSWNTTFYNNINNPGNLGSSGFLRFYH